MMKKLFTLFLLSSLMSTVWFTQARAESEAFSCQWASIALQMPSNTATGEYRLVVQDPNINLLEGPANLVAKFINPTDPEHTIYIYDRDVEYVYEYNPTRIVEAIITLPRPLRAYGDSFYKNYTLEVLQGMFKRDTGNEICAKNYSVIVYPNTPENVTISSGATIYATDCPGHYLGMLSHNMNYLSSTITYAQESSPYKTYFNVSNQFVYLKEGIPNYQINNQILSVDVTINGVETNFWIIVPVDLLNHWQYPQKSSISPSWGSTSVNPNVDPVINFNYNVTRGTGMIRIQKASNFLPGVYFDDIVLDVTDPAEVAISGNTVTLYPTSSLDYWSDYRIMFDDCAIRKSGDVGYYRDYTDSWEFETGGFVITLPRDAEGQPVDEEFISGLSAYPNPAADALTVRLDLEKAMDVSVRLVGLDGRTVWEKELGETSRVDEALDVSQFQRGMYLLQVATDEGIHVEKVSLH